MTSVQASTNAANWQQQAAQHLLKTEYTKAANIYEQAIAAEPEVKPHYWHLGLMMLLQGQEAEAQMTWLLGMAEGEPEQIETWTDQLVQVLHTEAERRQSVADYKVAWVIRQHIREIAPTDVNNVLCIILISIQLETFIAENLTKLGIIELLQVEDLAVETKLLLQVLQSVLNYDPNGEPATLAFVSACLSHTQNPQEFIYIVMIACIKFAHSMQRPALASQLAELCLHQDPNNTEVLKHLTIFYQNSYQYLKGIDTAKLVNELAKSLADKVHTNHLLIRALMSASGFWEEAYSALLKQQSLLSSLIQEWPTNLEAISNIRLYNAPFFLPYFNDDPRKNHFFLNQLSLLCYENIQNYAKDLIEQYRYKKLSHKTRTATKKVLKIGYISHCLRHHSVGWISRWLFQHHDSEHFQIYIYLVGYLGVDDFMQHWFIDNTYRTYRFEIPNTIGVLEQIHKDEIDILIDMDSITLDGQCEVFSIKPAPIQVTWLGWDASGLPSIDYFIADPYVLPESAQDYYTEKIWRLPNTYVAVDGFEVGIPTLRREHLDINSDAIVYFVTQRGYKRHLDNVRLQMKILKEVPNSYLLIKGVADEESTKTFFKDIAKEVGVSCDRLRFLPIDRSEEVHRANLGIADIVLDTYPYNGATTTLETLWMGVPLVTRVGQQFAARNSYAMMMNVGVTEGIAWTDEEYVEWGVRLGKDSSLRQKIAWKLRQSRQTAPLWNAKQFTREMEKAYKQMWQRYVEAD